MGRKKKVTPTEAHKTAEDGMLAAMCDSLKVELGGDRIRSQEEIVSRLVGLPVPGLAFRYLIQQDVFPLGRITTINGLQESCKSSLMFEIMRWHLVYGGLAMLVENETKDSPDIRDGLWDHNQDFLNRKFRAVQTQNVEEWQQVLTYSIDAAKKYCNRTGGPGRSVPCVFGIDSLSAKASQEDFVKINKAGHAERGYSNVALHTTKYLQALPTYLIDWPFTVIGIQHLKKTNDPRTGAVIRNKPGGKAIAFMETFEFEMSRIRDIQKIDEGGVNLRMQTRKNSLGPGRISIDVVFRWWWEDDPATGLRIQKHVFDWDDASMALLVQQAKDKKTVWKRINEIVDLHPQLSKRRVWSRELGIPEDSPASFADAYRVIEYERPDILVELYKVLGIRQRRAFEFGQDYVKMVESEGPMGGIPAPTMYGKALNTSADIADTIGTLLPPETTEEAAFDPSASEDMAEI